jgi:hypothetical protein
LVDDRLDLTHSPIVAHPAAHLARCAPLVAEFFAELVRGVTVP